MAVSQPLPDYNGYLKPWVSEIARLHRDGIRPAAIADIIRKKVRAYYSTNPTPYAGTTPGTMEPEPMVRALIKRLDGKSVKWVRPNLIGESPEHPLERLPNPKPVQVNIVELHRSGMSVEQISRELARRLPHRVRRHALRKKMQYYEAEHLEYVRKVIKSWAFRVVLIAHERGILEQTPLVPSRGRPLDMGGPRDEWIERDPWSEQ